MKVIIKKIGHYDKRKIYTFLEEAAEASGLWARLSSCRTVLIKPNLLGPYEPEKSITTHPVILEALIELLQSNGKQIWLGDSPGGSNPVEKVWEKTGINSLTEKYEFKLLNFSDGSIRLREVNGLKFSLSSYLWQADAVINVAKYKTHSLMYYTGAVKNLYGLIPGLKKSDYHKHYPKPAEFTEILSSLYELCRERISWNILDGITGMEGDGPSAGIPRKFGIMMASDSASALDHVAAGMMGFRTEQVKYVQNALKVDGIDPQRIEVDPVWRDFEFGDVRIKKISNFIKILAYSPKFLKVIFSGLYKYHPDFNDNCTVCGVCARTCPVAAIEISEGENRPEIDLDKCINCLCCHEVCPHQAVFIKKSALARLLVK